jgi:hypothetical protein
LELSSSLLETLIEENTQKEDFTAKESMCGQMEITMKANFSKAAKTVRAN